jgi:hypothetical protein
LAAAAIAVLLLVLAFAGLTGPARLLLTAAFTFFVPGRAIVSNWSRMAGWSDIGMSIALSLGVLTLFATVSLWARVWHPLGLFQIEAVASLIGLGVAVARRRAQADRSTDGGPQRPSPPRYPSDDRVERPGPTYPPERPVPPPERPVPPRADPRYPPQERVPPRPGPRYPPPARPVPPRADPRYPPEGRGPRRPDPRYPPPGRVPPPSSYPYPPRDGLPPYPGGRH